jgi:hypothetical protein
MRRQNSNLNEDVILFLGECDILTLNSTQQIALSTRTLLLKEDVLLTYQSPISSVRDSRLSRTKAPIALDRLTNHERNTRSTQTSIRSPQSCGQDCYWDAEMTALRHTSKN